MQFWCRGVDPPADNRVDVPTYALFAAAGDFHLDHNQASSTPECRLFIAITPTGSRLAQLH
jgi:hypothetical protein